jgi:hypothetical protein
MIVRKINRPLKVVVATLAASRERAFCPIELLG